jgi:hypothetical protein
LEVKLAIEAKGLADSKGSPERKICCAKAGSGVRFRQPDPAYTITNPLSI